MRSPAAMVASGYLFHLRGSEIHWTGSSECSRDLCTLPENTAAGISKHAAEAEFQARKAAPWLASYGCPPAARSYNDCLNRLDVAEGLLVEERRAGSTLSTMLDFDELARTALPRSCYTVIVLPSLTREKFNGTVGRIVSWLGIHILHMYILNTYVRMFRSRLYFTPARALGLARADGGG